MSAVKTSEWMRDCPVCAGLIAALERSRAQHPIAEFEAVREHLVDSHLAQLPGYVPGCANCTEWQVLAGRPDGLDPTIVPVLGREDLLHRAGHLFM